MSTKAVLPTKATRGKAMINAKTEAGVDKTQVGRMQNVTEDMLRSMVAEAAYYRALKRNFTSGSEQEDWILAEQEIQSLLSSSTAKH